MWTCACCKKELPDRAIENIVVNEEGDDVSVGSDCAKKIREAGTDGYSKDDSGEGVLYTHDAYGRL
jgi:hypothetical protein